MVAAQARLLVDGSNAIVELRPYPVVARVATATARLPGRDVLDRQATEVAVAGHAAGQGAPVVRPSPVLAPGPHEQDGLTLTFWQRVDTRPGRPRDPAAAGAALRRLHEALASYPGPLRRWGMYEEARHWAASPALDPDLREELAALGRAIDARLAASPLADPVAAPVRPLHGDAHLGNLLRGPAGPVWGDLEDAHAGPVEWDLACVLAGPTVTGRGLGEARTLVVAYGRDPDDPRLEPAVLARAWLVAAWCAVRAATDRPRLAPLLDVHVNWLRGQLPEAGGGARSPAEVGTQRAHGRAG